MKTHFTRAIFSPENIATSWIVCYFCCYQDGGPTFYEHPNESVWIVPGTLDMEL